MKNTLIASAITLLYSQAAFAETLNVQTDDVVVTASRFPQTRKNILGDLTVITQEEIERAGAASMTDLLRTQPGIQISTSGGAGKASSVFLRGTNADHVVILIDGIRINSATLGTTSLESIPLAQIEKIEILRGPASSLYGADAIGGVIQIFTKKGIDGKPIVHAAIGYGSFNTKTAEAGISGSVNDTSYGINLNSFDTKGFSARRILANNKPIDQDNDNYRNLGVSAYLTHTIVQGHSVGVQYFGSENHNSYDGNNFDNYGNQSLQSFAFTSNNQITDLWHSTLKLGKGIDDSSDHSSFGNTFVKTQQNQYTWQNEFILPLGTLTIAYDRLEQKVNGSSTFPVSSRDNNGYLASYLASIGNHAVQASARLDDNSQFGEHSTGGISYGYHITPEWKVSTSYGSAFKAPTFNQLYSSLGNPKLEPEESRNYELGLHYDANRVHGGLTFFDNEIKNLISFTGPPTGFNVVSTSRANIQGATFDGAWNVSDSIKLNGNLTLQSAKDGITDKMLVRRGNSYGTVSLMHEISRLQWGAEISGASARYNDAANSKRMGGYTLLNLTANYTLNQEWKLESRINNLLDKDYVLSYTGNTATSDPYNTAGINAFVGLRYQMKP